MDLWIFVCDTAQGELERSNAVDGVWRVELKDCVVECGEQSLRTHSLTIQGFSS